MSVRRRTTVGLMVAAAVLVGCRGGPSPATQSPVGSGFVSISLEVVGRGTQFFNSQHRARVVDASNSVIAEWEITAAAAPAVIPAGSWRLETFTVFFSDFLQCSPDPAVPGKERCTAPTLGPAQVCAIPINVDDGATVEATFRSLEEGACDLVAAPAASGSPIASAAT